MMARVSALLVFSVSMLLAPARDAFADVAEVSACGAVPSTSAKYALSGGLVACPVPFAGLNSVTVAPSEYQARMGVDEAPLLHRAGQLDDLALVIETVRAVMRKRRRWFLRSTRRSFAASPGSRPADAVGAGSRSSIRFARTARSVSAVLSVVRCRHSHAVSSRCAESAAPG